jgi:hypothetical protein
MLQQIVLGSVLMVVTTFVHAACSIAALRALRMVHADRLSLGSWWVHVSLIAMLVLMMFFAALIEVSIWAWVYLAVDAFSEVETALYFSTVTFTTLGYGDVVLEEGWRLLGSFQAANGTIMFGWTTALIFAFVHRLASHDEALAAGRSHPLSETKR